MQNTENTGGFMIFTIGPKGGSFLIASLLTMNLYALTLDGNPRNNTLVTCFEEAEIGASIGYGQELDNKLKWVKDAIELDSWGYYTNLSFTGWGDCASFTNPDIRITIAEGGGAWSGGDTIGLPFNNLGNQNFERYHIQSGAIHEMGHQLRFPHEHLRVDSTYYNPDANNQKFRIRMIDSTWFTIVPDVNQSLCFTIASTDNPKVTQEICTNSTKQRFKFKDGSFGSWSRIQNKFSGKCLDIEAGSTADNAKLLQWGCHTGDNQYLKTMKYNYANTPESIYGLQIKHSHKWLDIPEGSGIPGVQPIQYGAYYSNYQELTTNYDPTSVMSYENGSRSTSIILLEGDISGSRSVYGNSGTNKRSDYLVAKISNKCFTFNGTQGSQEVCNDANVNQKFRAVYLDSDYFRIFDENTQKCLTESNNNLTLASCSPESHSAANDHQRFILLDGESSSWSRIQSKSSQNCLDIAWGDITSGTSINLYGCHSGENQKFSIQKDISDLEPYKLLKVRHSGKCLTVQNGYLKQYTCSASNTSQTFESIEFPPTEYIFGLIPRTLWMFKNNTSNTCMAATSTAPASALRSLPCNEADNKQKFELIQSSYGSFLFRNEYSGYCVDIDHALQNDGATVLQWYCNDSTNQQISVIEQ